MARKQTVMAGGEIVTVEIEHRTYQIDPEQRKVYRRFVEIETSKAAEIFSIWRAQQASA
jgi:hypothetical protein